MNQSVETSGVILNMLEEENKQIETKIQELDKVVEKLVQSNGSGDILRKKLRTRLKKGKFLKTCRSALK